MRSRLGANGRRALTYLFPVPVCVLERGLLDRLADVLKLVHQLRLDHLYRLEARHVLNSTFHQLQVTRNTHSIQPLQQREPLHVRPHRVLVPLRSSLEPDGFAQLVDRVVQLRQRLEHIREQARLELCALRRLAARVHREERRADFLERPEERDELLWSALAVLDAAEAPREVGQPAKKLAQLSELGRAI